MLPHPPVRREPRGQLTGTLIALVLAGAVFTPLVTASEVVPGDANGDGLVVIAIVDSGINPYHSDFSAASYPGPADLSLAPGAYLAGYPAATRVDLSVTMGDYDAARSADQSRFEAIREGTLVWFPGTKIVGAIDFGGTTGVTSEDDRIPILDEDGHGTKSASAAVGNAFGSCPGCLLVVVEGFAGLAWAADQPWIDIVSNSWGTLGNVGIPLWNVGGDHRDTRPAAERGQTILFAAGNGVENGFVTPEQTYAPNSNGPDWVVNVGAAVKARDSEDPDTPDSYYPILGTGHPTDVIGQGLEVPTAHPFHVTNSSMHSGTSAATPIVAGVMGHVLLKARAALANPANGQPSRGHAAAGTPVATSAILDDGILTRAELWRVVFHTARPTDSSWIGIVPPGLPSTGTLADVALEGYGVVDNATRDVAVKVVLGHLPEPDRSDTDFFFSVDASVRDLFFGPWDRDGSGVRTRHVVDARELA